MSGRSLTQDPYVNLAPECVHYGAAAIRSLVSTVALLGLLVAVFLAAVAV